MRNPNNRDKYEKIGEETSNATESIYVNPIFGDVDEDKEKK